MSMDGLPSENDSVALFSEMFMALPSWEVGRRIIRRDI
jgi:hypothetical protein